MATGFRQLGAAGAVDHHHGCQLDGDCPFDNLCGRFYRLLHLQSGPNVNGIRTGRCGCRIIRLFNQSLHLSFDNGLIRRGNLAENLGIHHLVAAQHVPEIPQLGAHVGEPRRLGHKRHDRNVFAPHLDPGAICIGDGHLTALALNQQRFWVIFTGGLFRDGLPIKREGVGDVRGQSRVKNIPGLTPKIVRRHRGNFKPHLDSKQRLPTHIALFKGRAKHLLKSSQDDVLALTFKSFPEGNQRGQRFLNRVSLSASSVIAPNGIGAVNGHSLDLANPLAGKVLGTFLLAEQNELDLRRGGRRN